MEKTLKNFKKPQCFWQSSVRRYKRIIISVTQVLSTIRHYHFLFSRFFNYSTLILSVMPDIPTLKRERKLRLTQNRSISRKIAKSVTKKTRQLQNDLISDTDRPTDNEHFTFKKL